MNYKLTKQADALLSCIALSLLIIFTVTVLTLQGIASTSTTLDNYEDDGKELVLKIDE